MKERMKRANETVRETMEAISLQNDSLSDFSIQDGIGEQMIHLTSELVGLKSESD